MRHDSAATAHDCVQILEQLERAVIGQRDTLELLLAATLADGHVLLEDRPGVGKTVLARALGRVLGLPVGRVQGTFDLLPATSPVSTSTSRAPVPGSSARVRCSPRSCWSTN